MAKDYFNYALAGKINDLNCYWKHSAADHRYRNFTPSHPSSETRKVRRGKRKNIYIHIYIYPSNNPYHHLHSVNSRYQFTSALFLLFPSYTGGL
jgi:hypothetical protein